MPDSNLTSSPHITVIDDEPAFGRSIAVVLQSRGYRVSVALTAEEGWNLIRKDVPHVILCDINMPGADGVDLYSLVKDSRQFANVPFVFLSGLFTPDEAKERSVDAKHGTYYLAKPVRGDELTHFIENVMAIHNPRPPAVD